MLIKESLISEHKIVKTLNYNAFLLESQMQMCSSMLQTHCNLNILSDKWSLKICHQSCYLHLECACVPRFTVFHLN